DSLLARQRELFHSLDPGVASVRNLMQEAQELIWWAMTMLKVQRAGYERSLSDVLKVKRISESYPSRSADLTASMLSVRG
ncbi:MAG: hypothetical protein JOZ62_01685, partial [Acidobacteriaceae bacterium]|nr:hypothetical protein [Acidobacteriaceae bacterium]